MKPCKNRIVREAENIVEKRIIYHTLFVHQGHNIFKEANGDKGIRLPVANFLFAPFRPPAQSRRIPAAHYHNKASALYLFAGLLRFESPIFLYKK